jgi:glycosyltransferase involved in cell wall biosynthesis
MNINLSAPINQLGYGVVGTNLLLELSKLNNVCLWPIGPIDCEEKLIPSIKSNLKNAGSFDYDAPSLRVWHQWDMGLNVGRGKKYGLTFFEMDNLKPNEKHSLDFLDKIFVCSDWAKEVVVKSGINESKVKVIRLGVDQSIFKECEIDNVKTTRLLSIGKWEIRKGHDLILDILENTFTPEDDFKLIMCCSNPFLSQEEQDQWISYYEKSKFFDKIVVLKNRLKTQNDVYDLMKKSDIGIFPYRAEAWNLELAEMLSIGKNCIATNYSGPTEYAIESGCYLINPQGTESANDLKWFDGSASWAKLGQNYVDDFSKQLKELHIKKQSGNLKKNISGIEFFKNHTWENACKQIVEEIQSEN